MISTAGIPCDWGAASGASRSAGRVRLDHLDMLRGVAALLVMSGHLRAFVFTAYAENPAAVSSVLAKGFYFGTSLGHLAVLAFFALSGFLVGGKAISDLLNGRFVWSGYLSRRLTRLWLVIVPVLILTFIFDRIGIALTDGVGYDGRYFEIFNSGPKPPSGVVHDAVTFLGNLSFLHTISVPIFGSNGPMWSLANEFWYYIIFPLAAWLVLSRAPVIARLTGAGTLAMLIYALPQALLQGGLIWVAGGAAAWSTSNPRHAPFWRHIAIRLLAVAVLIGAVLATKVAWLQFGDIAFGLAIAATLPALALMPSPGGLYRRTARAGSEISYSLYLTHFPLLALIALVWLGPSRYAPGTDGALVYAALLLIAIALAALVWWCFERHTDRVYAYVCRLAGIAPQRSAAPAQTP